MPSMERNNIKADVTTEKNTVVTETESPIKMCITILDKKLRNLDKRKGKLDTYKEKSDRGEKLNKDQQEAMSKYEVVLQNLEFARDLQKQFVLLATEVEKAQRKQAKREKIEKQHRELLHLQEVLKIQTTLDSLGADDVRADLLKHKSLTLKEEELNRLDEFYTLIVPSRDGEKSFDEHLIMTSEHLLAYLDRSDKSVVGTTYKELYDLITRINSCGYFDGLTDVDEVNKLPDLTSTKQPEHDVGDGDCKREPPAGAASVVETTEWYKEESVITGASSRYEALTKQDISQSSFNFLQDSQVQSGSTLEFHAVNRDNKIKKQYTNGEQMTKA